MEKVMLLRHLSEHILWNDFLKEYRLIALLIIILSVIFAIRYYQLHVYDHKWFFNYLDQFDIEKMVIDVDKSAQIIDTIEYCDDLGNSYVIHIYDDWYDVYVLEEALGEKYWLSRVFSSDKYEFGPSNIRVGMNELLARLFLGATRKSEDLVQVLSISDDGRIEMDMCNGYLDSEPCCGGYFGMLFEAGKVKSIFYTFGA